MANNSWIAVTSPGDYGTAGNWSDGVPTAADVVVFENSNIDVGSGNLNQSAVSLTSFTTFDSYQGVIGIHDLLTTPGTAGTYLQIDAATVTLGRRSYSPTPQFGSPRTMIDIGATTACTMIVESTAPLGNARERNYGLPPVRIKGNKTTHVLEVRSGYVGVAANRFDETSTFGTIRCGSNGTRDCGVTIGQGVTINDQVDVAGGNHIIRCAVPVLNIYSGVVTHVAGAISTSATVHNGGVLVWNSTTTAVLITVRRGGKLVLTGSNAARTITTLKFDDWSDVTDNNAVTITTRTPETKGGGSAFNFGVTP